MVEIMDEFGGILTGGLLGNPVLAAFNLSYVTIEVVEEPATRAGGGGSRKAWQEHFGFKPKPNTIEPETTDKYVVIYIALNGEVTRKKYKVNDTTARISINILNTFNDLKSRAIKIKHLFIREQKDITLTVRINKDDRD